MSAPRPIGRPRREIDLGAVADAVAELFDEGGYDNVSIEGAAEKLSMSRATLYRTVPTKDHLLGILFERSTADLHQAASELVSRSLPPREQLDGLIGIHVDAAIRMRRYMAVFFGGAGLPPEVYQRWHTFSHRYEDVWLAVVTEAIEGGELAGEDPVLVTRLLLGMCIWVSRWYRPSEGYTSREIADAAIGMLGAPAARRVRPASQVKPAARVRRPARR